MEYPQEPSIITLSDGVPRQLRFTNGSLKRLKRGLGVEKRIDIFDMEFGDIAAELIYEAQYPTKELTVEEIDELMPLVHMAEIQAQLLSAMTGKSVEEIKNLTSQPVTPKPEKEISTGYVNGPSAAISESPQ
jgi:hypothetical protein